MGANQILEKILSWANLVLPEDTHDAPSAAPPPLRKPESLLLVPSRFIGDNVLLTPLIRNLRYQLGPQARLDIVTPSAMYPFFETLPWLDGIHREKQGTTRNPKLFLEQQGYDTVILTRYSPIWANAALRAEIGQRVGFDLERLGLHGLKRWGHYLTHAIPSTSVLDTRPQIDIYLDILSHFGLSVQDRHLECHLTTGDHRQASLLLHRGRGMPKILIQAGAGSPGKQWPLGHWRQLLTLITARWPEASFVAIGSSAEKMIYQELETEFPILNLCGETHLRESIALITRMDLVITLDTSIAHLAAVAGAPRLVVLYGPTNEAKWRPAIRPGQTLAQVHLDLPCRPCMARTCNHKSCMRQLDAETVFDAIEQVFRENPLPAFIRTNGAKSLHK